MSSHSTVILGTGAYAPVRVVTNEELSRTVDTSDEWIRTRSGIRERRIAGHGEETSDMGVNAARRALEDAGVKAAEIDLLVVATVTPDMSMPSAACLIQHKLGVPSAAACFDLNAACSGFIYALDTACAMLGSGRYKKALVIGVEKLSAVVDWKDRTTCVLFGDGAGAVVIGGKETSDAREGITYTSLHADGSGAMDLYLKIFDISRLPYVWYDAMDPAENLPRFPQMHGKKVFLHAVRAMVLSTNTALGDTGLAWRDIDWYVPHQANLRINEAVAEYADIPRDKVLNSIMWYGNTTAATVPLTIDHWRKQGKVKKGDRILSTVFGSGYTWGSAIFTV